jgi:hypothetical protein
MLIGFVQNLKTKDVVLEIFAELLPRDAPQNAFAIALMSQSFVARIDSGPLDRTNARIADSGTFSWARRTRWIARRSRSVMSNAVGSRFADRMRGRGLPGILFDYPKKISEQPSNIAQKDNCRCFIAELTANLVSVAVSHAYFVPFGCPDVCDSSKDSMKLTASAIVPTNLSGVTAYIDSIIRIKLSFIFVYMSELIAPATHRRAA